MTAPESAIRGNIPETQRPAISSPTDVRKNNGAPAATSVLQQLDDRKRFTRSRKGRPPAWLQLPARLIHGGKRFLRVTLPAFLREHRDQLVTAAVSLTAHILIVLLLAFWMLPQSSRDELMSLLGGQIQNPPDEVMAIQEIVQPETLTDLRTDSSMKQMLADVEDGLTSLEIDDPLDQPLQLPVENLILSNDLPVLSGTFGGRSEAGKQAALQRFGGSAESEQAVNLGLKWLQSIQRTDGSWCFAEIGDARSPGYMDTTDMGATALALLCYLGSGQTHQTEGPFRETVQKGLNYLTQNARTSASGADLRGQYQEQSGMYVQGIATICICEAAALAPSDKQLRKLATQAIAFIERAQHRAGGGWRYQPGEPGDTSVVGWQLMALQSAKSGRIRVAGSTLRGVREFLTSVQADEGSRYGYMSGRTDHASMTAVGLLCRMYLGWKPNNEVLQRGVKYLAERGPSREDMYYNYYATQVLHHFGGQYWNSWNSRLRQQLVETQITEGPAAGSWDVTDPHGNAGGRIYQTALSILTLEVYYRHLPLYRELGE